MIIVALGSNVAGPWGTPEETLQTALRRLDEHPTTVVAASALRTTEPFGITDQPDFVNAAAILQTELSPQDLMARLHDVELQAERRRTVRWGPRTLDLDLLDYDGVVMQGKGSAMGHQEPLVLPHPGIPERRFVLTPVAEIAPDWRHPVLHKTAQEMLDDLRAPRDELDA